MDSKMDIYIYIYVRFLREKREILSKDIYL